MVLNDSVIAMRGWLHHLPGLGRLAYPEEITSVPVTDQLHLSDGCHRYGFIKNMYKLTSLY